MILSPIPLKFFETIEQFDSSLIDILRKLKDVPQNKLHHPEGNTLIHTVVVTSRAFKTGDKNLVVAALFHDIGKLDTLDYNTKTGEPTAYKHEKESLKYVDQFKDDITKMGCDIDIIKFVVENHMRMKVIDQMRDAKRKRLESHKYFRYLKSFSVIDRGGTDI